jgi:hypothetical protein
MQKVCQPEHAAKTAFDEQASPIAIFLFDVVSTHLTEMQPMVESVP